MWRQGERETRGRWNKETRRHGDKIEAEIQTGGVYDPVIKITPGKR
jgi:hypothetical protein